MRYDRNFAYFAANSDWYKIVHGYGYAPTETTTPNGLKALKKYNSYYFKQHYLLDDSPIVINEIFSLPNGISVTFTSTKLAKKYDIIFLNEFKYIIRDIADNDTPNMFTAIIERL